MAPNEQQAADQQEKPKLGSLSAVEAVVNEYAKKFAKKHRVREDDYSVSLVTQFKGIMGLKRGPVVQIILLWPDAQPNMNTLLDSAFKTISRNRLVDGLAVEPVLHIRKRVEERRRWLREKIGTDEADIILDLIPKHRILTTVTTSVEYKDVVTGEKITITHQAKPEHYRGTDVASWLKLSRIVRDNHPEEAMRYVSAGNTPELDAAIASGDVSAPSAIGSNGAHGDTDAGSGSDEGDKRNDGEEHDAPDSPSSSGLEA